MPHPIASLCRNNLRREGGFRALYVALLLLSLHYSFVLYVHSSFLAQFISDSYIGAVYALGAVTTLLVFLAVQHIIARFGTTSTCIVATILEFITLVSMAFVSTPTLAVVLFVIQTTLAPLILFTLDVMMEGLIGSQEGVTGRKRGIFLTIVSFAAACAVFFAGAIIGNTSQFSMVYLASASFLIPFLFVIQRYFLCFQNKHQKLIHIYRGLSSIWANTNVRHVFCAHFLLQIFFSWMVMYTPIYLTSVVGFSWEDTGKILFVGLMAYVLFEYVIGFLADNWCGEREMMAIGFVVIAIATSWFIFLTSASMALWMVAMFMTRVGGSLVEVTTESYFFKHVRAEDMLHMSMFRIIQPIGFIAGSILGAISVALVPWTVLFLVLGIIMITGTFIALRMKDTR